jgi:hypothetical protein
MSHSIVEVGGIRVTEAAIAELDSDGRALVSISRENVTALHMGNGYVAERMLASLVSGVALTLAGLYVGTGIVEVLLERSHDLGRRECYLFAASAFLLVMGPWLAAQSVRKGPFITVKLREDQRKLAFHGATSANDIAAFASALQASSSWQNLLRSPNSR